MNDEEKRIRYRNIANRLRTISGKIEELSGNILALEDLTKKNIEIDNNVINYENFNSIKNKLNDASRSIRGSTIPSINSKMNKLI